MKYHRLLLPFLIAHVLFCGAATPQQQDQSLWVDYQKLSRILVSAPIFVPHVSFWRFVMAPEKPDQLQKHVQELAEAAARQHDTRLQARALILQAQLPTTEQPAALHELRTARQMSQSISDDEGIALSELGEAYRAYRAGDELSSRAHLYKAQPLYSRQHSVEGQLRCLSLRHLLEMPGIQPGDLFSSDADDAALAAQVLAAFSGEADGTKAKMTLLSNDWQKQRSDAGENATKMADGWVMLFDAYQQYQAGHTEEAVKLWGQIGQSHDADPLLKGLSWLGMAQIGSDKIRKKSDADQKDTPTVHDALAKARQAFASAQRLGGVAQAELLGAQVDFLLHHEKDARDRLQRARKLFADMSLQPGILETELISAEGENSIGNSAGSSASLDAARRSLGTVAGGAALHGQLLRVPADDVQRLTDFYSRDAKEVPIEQRLSDAYEFHAWASATEDPLLKMVALQDLSNALIVGGYLDDYLYYATEGEDILQRYMQRVPLALRLQKAALLEYDFLRKTRIVEHKTESFTTFNAPLLIDVYVAAQKAMRPASFDVIHEDASKHDAEFQQSVAEMRKLAVECEAHRQDFLTAVSGDPRQAIGALGQFIESMKNLFEYLNLNDVQGDSRSYDEKITQTLGSFGKPGSQEVKVEADIRMSLTALYLRYTKIEMLQESAYLDFVRDVIRAAITGNEAMATAAANNLASFYELYRDQLSAPGEVMLPFSFLKDGGMGALNATEKRRLAERQNALTEALARYEKIHAGMLINKVVQQYAPSSTNVDPMTLNTGTLAGNDPLLEKFEHIKQREVPDQTEVTTHKEGEVLVISIKHSHSAWFEITPKSEYFRMQPSQITFDVVGNVTVLRSAQDPYLVPASPSLNDILKALNAGSVEQLMYASLTGSSLQKAVQSVSTFSHIIQAGQVALSMHATNDFVPQPGSRSAAEWRSFIKDNPASSRFSSLLVQIQLAATPDTLQESDNPVQAISGFFGKLSKVVSTMSGDTGQTPAEDSDEEDDDGVSSAARGVGQIPELATLVQYPSLLFLIMDDRENSQKIATALQSRLPKKNPLSDSAPIHLDSVTPGQRVSILTNSALFHIATGSYKEAQAELGEAVGATGEGDPSEAFQFHYLRAMCARRSDDPDRALKELESAMEELEHLRSTLTTRSLALALQPVRQMIYDEYMGLVTAKGDSKAMLAALQQYKKSTQIPVASLLENPGSSDVASQVDEITMLYDLESRRAIQTGPDASSWLLDMMASSFGKSKQPHLEPTTVALSTLNNVANVLINQIQPVRLHPRLSHEDLKYNLKKDELAIVYFAGSRGLYALTVDETGTRRVHYVAINAEVLFQLCQKFRAQIVAHTDVSGTAVELYRITLGKVAELEGKTRLKIWPDGPLQFVPFQALKSRPDAKYLVQSYMISYLTGVSGAATPQTGDSSGALLLVGNPDGSLPAAEDEVNSISHLPGFKPVPLIERQATLQNLQRNVGAAGLVHFATHARANELQPNFSFLQLAPYDRLYSIDLGGMRFAGKQVFLSACETNVGEYIPGEDIYGISDVFLAAGAGSVVATLWRVESQSSALFAERYYSAWQAEKDGAAALAQVARDFIEGRSYLERNGEAVTLKDPIYWAGFNRIEPWSSLAVQ